MADRVQRLREAAQARHEATLRRAEDTLRQLAHKGGPITFRRVAEEAGVSRAWLYRQDQLRAQIDQLRGTPSNRAPSVPAAERATPTPCANNYAPTEAR